MQVQTQPTLANQTITPNNVKSPNLPTQLYRSVQTATKNIIKPATQIIQPAVDILPIAVKAQIISLLFGALAFTTALAWNSAIQSLFKYIYVSDTDSLKGKLIFAIVVTLLAIIVAYATLTFAGRYDPKAKLF